MHIQIINESLQKARLIINESLRKERSEDKKQMVFYYQNCSSDREKLLKFETEGREFAKFLRSLEQFIQTVIGYQKLFLPFTVWVNCSKDVKKFANSQASASNFKSFSRSLEQFWKQNSISN